jgi:hypothetical protein
MAKIARPRLAAIAWISALLHSEVYFLIKSTNLGFLDLLQVKTEMRGHKLLCNEVGHFSFKNTARLPPRIISKPGGIASTQLASRHDRRPEAMASTMQADIAFPNHNFYEQLNFGPGQLDLSNALAREYFIYKPRIRVQLSGIDDSSPNSSKRDDRYTQFANR